MVSKRLSAVTSVTVCLAGVAMAHPAQAATPHPLVIVMLENASLQQVTDPAGQAAMPYLNRLWADPATEQFTHYAAVTHPSFPNYAALASGHVLDPGGNPSPGSLAATTVWDQLSAAGVSWGVYLESMPTVCSALTSYADVGGANGEYKLGHNPAVPFTGVFYSGECTHVRPLTAMVAGALPAVSYVAPNLCDDMHGVPASDPNATAFTDCITATAALAGRGDSWLAAHVPVWTAAGADVLITFDESTATGNQVYTVLTGPGVSGGRVGTPLSHYSVLAGVEDAYGLPRLGAAATAVPIVLPAGVVGGAPGGCPAPPPGASELSGTVSVDDGQTGWMGVASRESRVARVQPAGGGFGGSWALRVGLATGAGGVAGVNNAGPRWVPGAPGVATVAGAPYVARAEVAASTPGEQVSLALREYTPAGQEVGHQTTTVTLTDTAWHPVATTLAARGAGDQLRYSLWVGNLAGSDQWLLADCLSLLTS